ncbi:hypothetical protein [Amycolatopsis thermoflava]
MTRPPAPLAHRADLPNSPEVQPPQQHSDTVAATLPAVPLRF